MENIEKAVYEGLNAEQRQAVSSIDGPALIVAGAGSGKTRVLTSRIACIIARGGDPSRILALTFTKKAASEMKERIAVMVGKRTAWKLQMGTFHSIFIRFLREYAGFLGWGQSTDNIVQIELECRPCSIYGQKPCRRGDYACMNGIAPETIVDKIENILSNK